MGNRVHVVADFEFRGVKALFIVDILLGFQDDFRHRFGRQNGIFARRGFSREHDGARAVVYGVGNVRNLGSRRTGVVNHGFQHLGGGDDAFSEHTALGNQFFLNGGQLLEGNFDAHIAAADHDALADFANILDVIYTGLIFDFGDERDGISAVLVKEIFDFQNVVLGGDERAGDVVDVLCNAEEQILFVLLAQEFLLQDLAGKTHALAVGNDAARRHLRHDVVPDRFGHGEGQKSVVDEDNVARFQFLCQILIADGYALFCAQNLVGSKGEGVPRRQFLRTVFKQSDTVFGTFGIKHDGDRNAEFFADFFDRVHSRFMVFIGAVREVETGDVHARLHQSLQRFFVARSRSDGTDDFRFAHGISSFSSKNFVIQYSKFVRKSQCFFMGILFPKTVLAIDFFPFFDYNQSNHENRSKNYAIMRKMATVRLGSKRQGFQNRSRGSRLRSYRSYEGGYDSRSFLPR